MVRSSRWLPVSLLFACLACGEDGPVAATPDAGVPGAADNFGVEETAGDPDCEPLDPGVCLLPYPSDRYLEVGPEGPEVVIAPGALPRGAGGTPVDPRHVGGDGWSVASPILFTLPGAQPPFPDGPNHLARSVEDDSPTLVLDAETGARVGHWLEVDHLTADAEPPLLALRAAKALGVGRRYVVAVRGLVDADGVPAAPSPTFAALRDGLPSETRGLHARRAHFEEAVFPVLEEAGVARADLQLAWDFTTASGRMPRELLAMRDDLIAAVGEDGPEYEVTGVDVDPDPAIAFMVTGVARVPSFVGPPADDGLRLLRRGADGRPRIEGTEDVVFEVQLPHAAFEGPLPVVQYGHGLLGSRDEGRKGWLREMAGRVGFVSVAIDLQGMAFDDGTTWLAAMSRDPARFALVAEQPLQGVLNHVAIVRMMRGRFASAADPRYNPDGKQLVDPARAYYYGNSQGGTMGNLVMAAHVDVQRGVLGVPGCAFGFLVSRSAGFALFSGAFRAMVPGPRGLSVFLAVAQQGLDRMEALSYVPLVAEDPDKQVLLHVAKEDASVPNLLSFLLGRSYDVPLMTPSVRPVWGLPEQTYPYVGSALVEVDFGAPDPADLTRPPPEEHDTHEHLRRDRKAQDQLWHFLETGEVTTTCDGPCDPG